MTTSEAPDKMDGFHQTVDQMVGRFILPILMAIIITVKFLRDICEFSLFYGHSQHVTPDAVFLARDLQLNHQRLAIAISNDGIDAE